MLVVTCFLKFLKWDLFPMFSFAPELANPSIVGQQHRQKESKLPCGQLKNFIFSHSKQCRMHGVTVDLVGFQRNFKDKILQSISEQASQNACRHRKINFNDKFKTT